jgi:hypothetical protein
MVRTTPPPPLDITAVFPELGPLGRRAIRLHPRAGTPDRNDSSLGGPLLWPAEEPWPVCDGWLVTERREPLAPEDFQRFRAIQDAAHSRWRPDQGQAATVTEEEAAEMEQIAAGAGSLDLVTGERCYLEPQPHRGPVALIPVLQLYAHDVPELPFPEQTDLFQLLWCPNWHAEPWHGPHPVTVWRRAAAMAEPLASPPAPRFDGLFPDLAQREYVPLPCVLHLERITEYPHSEWPYSSDLPDALAEQLQRWDEQQDGSFSYWNALSTAPGTKVGGHPRWVQGPEWPRCRCGLRMHHLLTVASDEFEIATLGRRWLPLEDRDDPKVVGRRLVSERDCFAPHGLMLGDVGSLYLFTCTGCAGRPLAGTMQAM